MNNTILGPLFIALCMLLRSTDVFFRSNLSIHIVPFLLITLEHLIGAIVLLPQYPVLKKITSLKFSDLLPLLFIICGSSVGGIYFFTKAFHHLNPAIVILLQKLQPLVSTALALLILREKASRSFFLLTLIALISSYTLTFQLKSPLSIIGTAAWEGSIYALLSVFFWGGGTVFGKKLLCHFSFIELTFFRYIGGSLFSMIILCLFFQDNLSELFHINKVSILSIIYIALIPGLFALFLFYKGLSKTSAIQASFIELIFPLCSTFFAWKFLNRPLEQIQIISGIILLASVTALGIRKN